MNKKPEGPNRHVKSVTCCVCGDAITKRKSIRMSDGTRACKRHPEAQDQKALEAAEAAEKQKEDTGEPKVPKYDPTGSVEE